MSSEEREQKLIEYEKRINNLTQEEWEPLLKYIPLIKETNYFGEMVYDISDAEVKQFPFSKPSELVSNFVDDYYKFKFGVPFDWVKWVEQFREMEEKLDFDTLDLVSKTKYIFALIRQDRFVDNLLVSCFQDGLILEILESIKKGVDKKFK